jgi:hypothetical protein
LQFGQYLRWLILGRRLGIYDSPQAEHIAAELIRLTAIISCIARFCGIA